MPSKDVIQAVGVTEDNLPPHLRKKRTGRAQNTSSVSSTSTNISVKSGEVIDIRCAENIQANQFIHIGTDGRAYNPTMNDKPATAFALGAGGTDVQIKAILSGIVGVMSQPSEVGFKIYLSGTYPFYSLTPTIQLNNYYQILGGIKSENDLIVAIEPAELHI